MSSLQQLLDVALGHHKAGDLEKAEALYDKILRANPRHAVALYLRGTALFQSNQLDEGIDLLQRAVAIEPVFPEAHANLGTALQARGRIDEAIQAYAQAIAIRPAYAEAHSNLGNALKLQGRIDEAIAAYTQAVAADPNYPEARYNLGIALQEQNRLDEAASAFRHAIAIRPPYAEAHSALGNTLKRQGKFDEAISAYAQAIAIRPNGAETHSNLGNVLTQQGRLDEAVEAYAQALVLQPNYPEAHYNLGIALQAQGRLDAAVAAYAQAVALRPSFAEACCNLGIVQQKMGRLDAAIAAYTQAIAIRPDFPEALTNLAIAHHAQGVALQEQGRLDAAIAAYAQAIAIHPDHAEAHFNLGSALHAQGRLDEAAAAYGRAIAIRWNYAEAHYNLGNVFKQQGRLDAAIAHYTQAIALKPSFAEAHCNLGTAFMEQDRFNEAIKAYGQAIAVQPIYPDAGSNLGNALQEQGRLDEAIAVYRAVLADTHDYPEAHYNMSHALLLQGDYRDGWPEYDWRWKVGDEARKARNFTQPQWRGEDCAGKTILLYAEQGLGDTLQFVRFVPLVAARGARVILEVQAALTGLLASVQGVERVVAKGEALPAFDLQLPLMSVPLALGTSLDALPAELPYVKGDAGREAIWRARLAGGGFKIGIVWQGTPDPKVDKGRSIPLRCFEPLSRVAGIRLISLQKNYGLDQLDSLPEGMRVETLGPAYDAGCFLDTTAVMSQLDLVVTSCTSVAHLAGALGRPVWIALKLIPDWRWMLDRSDSPWYPTARLFRQRAYGAWDRVFVDMAEALTRELAGERATPPQAAAIPGTIPVPLALGDLIDRITILELKAERIEDAAKLANVRRQLALLMAARTQHGLHSVRIDVLTGDLKDVNAALWEAEDGIRACERDGDFNMRFVELTRSTHRSNDRRRALKGEINRLAGSAIIEEKSYAPPPPSAPPTSLTILKPCRHGRMLFLKDDVYIGRSLELYGEYSEEEPALFRQIVGPGGIVVEAGANIGAHTIPLARMVGPQGRIKAFEPQRPIFQILSANAALNELFQIEAIHAAIGAAAGTIRVPPLDYCAEGNFGGISLGGSVGEEVAVVTVDSLGLSRFDLLKVDVEGMEAEVLAGAADAIGRLRPALYVENDRRQSSPRLISQIAGYGYDMWWHMPRLFNPDNHAGNAANIFGNIISINLLCLPKERGQKARDLHKVTGPEDWRHK